MAEARKRKMTLITAVWAASIFTAAFTSIYMVATSVIGNSDRYVLMRLALMRIANGQYEDAKAMAQQTMDVVNDIDDERVREYYEKN